MHVISDNLYFLYYVIYQVANCKLPFKSEICSCKYIKLNKVFIIISIIIIIIIIIIVIYYYYYYYYLLYILELTVGFETNLKINSDRKLKKYLPLISDQENNFDKVKFVNVSISSLGVFGQSANTFIDNA